MKHSLFLFLCLSFGTYFTVFSQSGNYSHKTLPSKYVKSVSTFENDPSAYDLTKCLPTGYVTDGSVDYTASLQEGINRHSIIRFPDFAIKINAKGLYLKSNSVLYFPKNSSLIIKPTDVGSYNGILIQNVQNVKIYNIKVKGDRKKHFGKSGQWGMGIKIAGSSNIQLYNPSVSECWGDGIYVGQYKDKVCYDIKIYNPVLDYNRRNGISIVSVNKMHIKGGVISNTMGHNPMAGVDIEPNNNNNIINDITIDDLITFNNFNYGIVLSLSKLLGNNIKNTSITINSHTDELSNYAFTNILGSKSNIPLKPLNGSIQINNPKWMNNKKATLYISKTYNNGLTLKVRGLDKNEHTKTLNLKSKYRALEVQR